MKMKCPYCGVSGSVSDSLVGKKVRCPKCKEVFRVAEAKTPVAPKKEPPKAPPQAPVMETVGHVTDAKPASGMKAQEEAALEQEIAKIFEDTKTAPGMTAQDEAALEQEIAKIFDDMKHSAMDNDLESLPDTRTSDEGPSMSRMNPDITDAGGGSISEEDLKSELEDMLGKKCSVCGTFVGQATKHEIGGNVYCSVCLPAEGGEESKSHAGKDLVSTSPELKKALEGYWQSNGMKFVGIAAIAITLVALFYFLFLK
jgi:predicted Zn finger-like uncharacterized protein